jgi:hypothetical protein
MQVIHIRSPVAHGIMAPIDIFMQAIHVTEPHHSLKFIRHPHIIIFKTIYSIDIFGQN